MSATVAMYVMGFLLLALGLFSLVLWLNKKERQKYVGLLVFALVVATLGLILLWPLVVAPTAPVVQVPIALPTVASPVPQQPMVPTQVPLTPTEVPAPTQSPQSVSSGSWEIELFSGATQQMRGWSFQALDPVNWPDFPNVDNPQVGFRAADGLEYGMDESLYCQRNQTCDIVVPAMHYRIISGDYNLGFDSCEGSVAGEGCAIMLVNVGNVSADFREIQIDLGFTVFGRYWNGDKMPLAIWAGLSHVVHNMLNLLPQVGSGDVNRGANCSVPQGCQSVRAAFVIMSGNEILVKGVTTVSR